MYNTITYRGIEDLKIFNVIFGHSSKKKNK